MCSDKQCGTVEQCTVVKSNNADTSLSSISTISENSDMRDASMHFNVEPDESITRKLLSSGVKATKSLDRGYF